MIKFLKTAIFVLLVFLCTSPVHKTQADSLWEDLGLYGGQINALAIDPDDNSLLYAGSWGGDGLFKSTDSGTTWRQIPESNPSWFRNIVIYDIAINPHNPATIWVANNHFIDVSYDYGETWKTFFFASVEDRFCYSVAVDPFDSSGNTVYVGTGGPDNTDEYGEIFFTIDGGDTWEKMNFFVSDSSIWNNFWQIRFNPNKQGEIWVANRKSYLSPDGFIYMTADYGEQWWYWSTAWWTDGELYYLGYLDEVLVHPKNSEIIFASDEYGILRKADGTNLETGWYWAGFAESCRSLCISMNEPDTIYAGLIDEVAKSTNSGDSWEEFFDAPSEFIVMAANPLTAENIYAGSINRGIFTTNDGADNWQTVNNGVKANSIFDTALSPTKTSTILSGTLAGIYLGTNSRQWQLLLDKISHTVMFHPLTTAIMYSGFDWEIGKTTDAGTTWRYLSVSEDENSHLVSSIALWPLSENNTTIVAGISYGAGDKGEIITIHDNGDDFSEASYETIFTSSAPVNALAVHPDNPQVMFAGTGSFYAPVKPGGIYITRNGGTTWQRKLLRQKPVVNSISIAPSNPDIVFAACGGSDTSYAGIYKSTNGGKSWSVQTKGLPKYFAVADIQVDSQNSTIVYAALFKGFDESYNNLGGTYITLDGGNYWTQLGLSDYRLYDINVYSENPATHIYPDPSKKSYLRTFPSSNIMAGTSSGLYSSTTTGTGIITGSVTAQSPETTIDGALITTQHGSNCVSSQGYYMLLVPAGAHLLNARASGYMQTTIPSLTVQAGQSIIHDIVMMPSGSDNESSCAVAQLLKESSRSSTIILLRNFRDRVLSTAPFGKHLISLYYKLEADVWQVLQHDPRLKKTCLKILQKSISVADALLARAHATVPAELRGAVSLFLYDLEMASHSSLQKKVNKLRYYLRGFAIENFLASKK